MAASQARVSVEGRCWRFCSWGRVLRRLPRAATTLAIFYLLAGKDPSEVLLTGCDLDCGQDLHRLADELRAQHISHVNIAIWSSAELSYMGLPEMEVLPPFQPVRGWVAISARASPWRRFSQNLSAARLRLA